MRRRISSAQTFWMKRVFPFFWFGFLTLFAVASLFKGGAPNSINLLFVIFPFGMMIFGFFLMKALVFDLLDEVWDEGDALRIRNKGREELVPLGEIMNISYSAMTNPPRMTLWLRTPGSFGQKIVFLPKRMGSPFKLESPLLEELVRRVDHARRE